MARITVEAAFDLLLSDGLIERRRGSGSYVSAQAPLFLARSQPPRFLTHPGVPFPNLSNRGEYLSRMAPRIDPAAAQAFCAGVADVSQFPWARWHAIGQQVMRGARQPVLAAPDPLGQRRLRQLIAQHLQLFRGVVCDEDQVVIFSSTRQALTMLGFLLLSPGDVVVVEDPGCVGLRMAFDMAGARLLPAAVDAQGMQVDEARDACPSPRAICVTPSHQYPSGGTLSLPRRLSLLQWAQGANAWIIEDDRDGEFNHLSKSMRAIQGMDHEERVIYLGSFNKLLFPGLRVAYAVVPRRIVETMLAVRPQFDHPPSSQIQQILAAFIEEGELEAHLRRTRVALADKRALLLSALSAGGLPAEPGPAEAGSHLTVRFRTDAPGPTAHTALIERMVAKAPEFGLSLDHLGGLAMRLPPQDALFLRFGGLQPVQIAEGVQRLARLFESTRLPG